MNWELTGRSYSAVCATADLLMLTSVIEGDVPPTVGCGLVWFSVP